MSNPIVSRLLLIAAAGINVFFMINIIRHLVRPGDNTVYTRMLMFAGLGTIPLVFIMGFAGGRDRWPRLLDIARDIAGPPEWYSPFIIAGLAAVTIVLPLVIFAGIGFMMELRSAILYIVYFIPVMMRLAMSTMQDCIMSAVFLTLLFLLTGPAAALCITFLERHKHEARVMMYERHLQKIWPGYGTAANMFFWVCLFPLCNQFIEFIRTVAALVRGWGW